MNRCKTCKWWVTEIKWGNEYHFCEHPMFVSDSEKPDEAGIYNDVNSALMTGPEFGCVKHEDKV